MNVENYGNLEKILNDKGLLEKLSKFEKRDEMERELKLYGLNLNSKEIENIMEFKKGIENLELKDSELEEIAGGFSLPKKLSAGALSLALGLGSTRMNGMVFAVGGDSTTFKIANQMNQNVDNALPSAQQDNIDDKKMEQIKNDLDKKNNILKSMLATKAEAEVVKLNERIRNIMGDRSELTTRLQSGKFASKEVPMDVLLYLKENLKEKLKKDSSTDQEKLNQLNQLLKNLAKQDDLTNFYKAWKDFWEQNSWNDYLPEIIKAAEDNTFYKHSNYVMEELEKQIDHQMQVITIIKSEQAARNLFDSLGKWGSRGMYLLGGTLILKNSGDIVDNVKNLVASGENKIKNAIFNLSHKGIDISNYQTTLQKIEERLKSELVGQDEAINRMMTIMKGHFESLVQAKESGKKHTGGLLLYLTGLPATGKSTAMRIIEEEMKLGSCIVRMSDIVEDKGNNAKSAASRLLKPVLSDNGKVKVKVDTNFARTINAGKPTLYCIDEVDKMRVWDATSQGNRLRNEANKIMGGSIDEMLRNFGDTGQINGIDASGSILVATSNESPEDLQQLESSLYNRYKYCNVKFKDLTAEDYKEIILRKSKDFKEYYKNKFDVDIEWDKSALDHYSEIYEKEKSGGRGVDALINEVRAVLKGFMDGAEELPEVCYLNFDASTNSLSVNN